MRSRTPYRGSPWPRRKRKAVFNVHAHWVPTEKAVPRVGTPSGMARSSRAEAGEDLSTAIKLLAPCHRRQRVLMAEWYSEPSA